MNRKRKLIAITIFAITCICMHTNKVDAALQANGGGAAVKDVNGWITSIRQMQATGQALGLTDTINGTNLTSGNKNLDIHMQKNTEYGAVVLLGASSYGNLDRMNANGVTTTGNKTGVVMNINKEWVAAGTSSTAATSMANAAGRYKNKYTAPNYTEKVGDGIATVGGWHGSRATTWLSMYQYQTVASVINRSCLIRSYAGSVFSYYGYGHNAGNPDDVLAFASDADRRKTWASRAVVVVGSGV